ncbi:MAG: FG-GAP repeat domain-containing protein, partial [bacterium]
TGQFKYLENALFDEDKDSEDTGCVFFDADNDGFPELYVSSGSNEVNNSSLTLMDRLYINKKGKSLVKSQQILPSPANLESTSAVKAADFDSDGDLDLFVGGRVSPNYYG